MSKHESIASRLLYWLARKILAERRRRMALTQEGLTAALAALVDKHSLAGVLGALRDLCSAKGDEAEQRKPFQAGSQIWYLAARDINDALMRIRATDTEGA